RAGGKVINLLCKGSLKHVQGQLRRTPEEHISDIRKSLAYARELGIAVNVYLEDWSNGMRNSPEYVYSLTDALKDESIKRILLLDTLGSLNTDETYRCMKEMVDRFPSLKFDSRAHNDYVLSVANCFSGVKAGAAALHVTVNGLGERAGNTPLSSVVAMLREHLQAQLSIDESKLYSVSKLVEVFLVIRVPANKSVIGEHVFIHTLAVHADG